MIHNDYVRACPIGWLLEALAGHPPDRLLFPRSGLRWVYCPTLWLPVVHPDSTTPTCGSAPLAGIRQMCACRSRPPYPVGHLPKGDLIGHFHEASLSLAVVRRRCRVTEPRQPTPSGRRPPDRIRTPCHERAFWAGRCPECGVIYRTLSPWVERSGDEYADEEYKRDQADKAKEA